MISDCVKSSLIPTDTVALWSAATLDCLAQLLGTANITLGHVEELLQAQSRKLMLPILTAAAQALAGPAALRVTGLWQALAEGGDKLNTQQLARLALLSQLIKGAVWRVCV